MPASDRPYLPLGSAFLGGAWAGFTSVFVFVLVGTYISIGALAHDVGFSLGWVMLSTALVWAGPAQVILITALGSGAAPVEVGLAVGLSGVRLLPMVVALLPFLKGPTTRTRELILPAHLTAVSMWVEALRLAPRLPPEARIPFANGIGLVLLSLSLVACFAGYSLASTLPRLVVAAMLFLTPMSFLVSVMRNSRALADRLAMVIGVVMAPLLALNDVGLDLLWTGLIGGSFAYAVHRLREALR
jgi:predicted branched-subunit amino acid permease